MAGIWDRVTQSGSETQIRVNVSLLRTELAGLALGVVTRADARAHIEANMGDTFTAAEVVDLNLIADAFETGSTQERLVYAHKVEFALNAGEVDVITEAVFRTVLGLP